MLTNLPSLNQLANNQLANAQNAYDAAQTKAELQQQLEVFGLPYRIPDAPPQPSFDPLRMVATGVQFTKHNDDPENTFRLYNGMGSIDFMLMVDLNQNPPQLVLVSCSTTPKP